MPFVKWLALAAMKRHPLHVSETLHAGSGRALAAGADLFVTTDARLAQAAHTRGLPIDGVRGDQKELT